MHTRFGQFVSASFFPFIFLLIYIITLGLSARNTSWALCLLSGRNLLAVPVCLFFLVTAFLILAEPAAGKKSTSLHLKRTLRFLSCFYIYYVLLLLDWNILALLFSLPSRARAVGVLLCIVASVLIVAAGYLHARAVTVKAYSLTLPCSREYHIAFFSDIHLGLFVSRKQVRAIVEKTNALRPDLILIAGDLFDEEKSLLYSPEDLHDISRLFQQLRAAEGVYAVVGNHDPRAADEDFRRFLAACHIRLLDDEVKILPEFNLVGRTDPFKNKRKAYTAFLPLLDRTKETIVLDHNPQYADENAAQGARLVLCGHTHKGQFFPVTLFTRWASGNDYFYGHRLLGKTHLIITSGAGFFGLPMRIGSDSEIVDITICPEKSRG